MPVQAAFAAKVLGAHGTADVFIAGNLVHMQAIIVFKIQVTNLTVIMTLIIGHFVVSELRFRFEAFQTAFERAWERSFINKV